MSCTDMTTLLVDRLIGPLAAADEQRLEAHLAQCAACREAAVETATFWQRLDVADLEVPHERMRARFHAALAAYEDSDSRSRAERWLALWWPKRPVLQMALAAALALAGVIVGQQLPSNTDVEIAALRNEVRTVGLALLDHQSVSERLLGVQWSRRTEPTPEVVGALLERVRYDTNTSVRLAAVDALRPALDTPDVSEGFALALDAQQPPLLQVALADALLATRGSAAIAAVRGLLGRDELDPAVREYLQTALVDAGAAAGDNTDI